MDFIQNSLVRRLLVNENGRSNIERFVNGAPYCWVPKSIKCYEIFNADFDYFSIRDLTEDVFANGEKPRFDSTGTFFWCEPVRNFQSVKMVRFFVSVLFGYAPIMHIVNLLHFFIFKKVLTLI